MDEQIPEDNQDKEGQQETANANSNSFMSGTDEQDYLRATWEKLGAGQDGLLSLNDLGKVCRAIGIEEESIHVIEQLFKGLDVDGDGRITFEEFMQIFKSANQSQVFDNSFKQETFDSPNSHLTSIRSTDAFTEVGILHSLDPDNTGFVQVSRLLEVWCSLGVPVGDRFLKEVGLPYLPTERIYLSDLSSAVEDDLRRLEEPKQCSAYLLLHEIRDLRTCLDTCREEKNKYRCDLIEANQRISHLAQEIDEHNIQIETASRQKISNLERQYKEQIKEFTDALKTEEEVSRDKVSTNIKQIEIRNAILKEEENRLKQQIALQDCDIRKLVSENNEVTDKLKEAQRQVEFMEKQISELRFLEIKMAEYDQSSPREDEYKSLLQKMEHLSCQNQVLRDKNDELLSKMDANAYKSTYQEREEYSLDGSVIGDYLDSASVATVSLKRRSHLSGGQERDSKIMKKSSDFSEKHIKIHYVDVGAYDESFDTSLSSQTDKCSVRKLDPILFHAEDLSPKVNRHRLQSPTSPTLSSLGCEKSEGIDSYKSLAFDRMPMASTPHKTKCYNCDHVIEKLKNFNDILIGMKVEECNLVTGEVNSAEKDANNPEKSSKLIGINTTMVIAKLQDRLESAVKTFNGLLQKYKMDKSFLDQFNSRYNTMADKIKRKRVTLTKFMADALPGEGITTIPEEEEALADLSEKGLTLDLLEAEFYLYDEKLLRERDNLEKQKAVVEERNLRIEKEVEILKTDLGSADDYWQMKIKEEQDYYEEERKLYDEKFLELEKKIKEYEVLLKIDSPSVGQNEDSDDSDRLSTIDENVYWEKHITEIEEELRLAQHRNEVLANEVEHLKLSHEKERKSNSSKFEAEILRLKLDVEFLRANLSSSNAKSDKVKETREGHDRKKQKVETHTSYDISNQLVQAKMRIHKLESTLKVLQKSTCEILCQTQEQHQAEIEAQQTVIDSTQQYLTSCLAKYKDQTVKVYKTDTLVKNLCLENTHLMLALQVTEERQKKAESVVRNLEMSQICSL